MNAETRAKGTEEMLSETERLALADELTNRKLKFADVVQGHYEMLSEIEMDCIVALLRQPDLAAALRQAENDKLEEAASAYDAKGPGGWNQEFAEETAAFLRSLKSKD